jgi:hypothetical protein
LYRTGRCAAISRSQAACSVQINSNL